MAESSVDVVVVGNVGVDTNVFFHTPEIDFTVEANFTENIDSIGQAGGYASRGYASLGARTAFIGYVGDDANGNWIRQVFQKQGISIEGLFIDPEGTSRSINFMYRDGRRKNFYDGKSHMMLMPDLEVCSRVLAGSKLAHFNIPNWARWLLPLARQAGAKIACDIQDVIDPYDPYRREFIEAADYLFFSAANHGDPDALIRQFLQMNPRAIVVAGMGAEGCAVGSTAKIQHFPPVHMDLPVVDTNGAGDGLAVGFLTSCVLDGLPIEEAVRRGQIAARWTCAQRASSDHLITRELMNRYIDTEKVQ